MKAVALPLPSVTVNAGFAAANMKGHVHHLLRLGGERPHGQHHWPLTGQRRQPGRDDPPSCLHLATIPACKLLTLRSWLDGGQSPKLHGRLRIWISLVIPATMMLRQHYLMDVYAGIFVGFATYWACMFIIERPGLTPVNKGPLLSVPAVSD